MNIALIEQGTPRWGLVYAPVLDKLWYGGKGIGAWRVADGRHETIQTRPHDAGQVWRVVGSRSHVTPQQQAFMQRLPGAQLMSVGSSIKLCMVAEGSADLYPKFGPTSEWDTAAGQAVVEAAGGQVLAWPGLTPLRYNQRPDTLINPDFMACARPDDYWALGGEKDSAAFPG